MKIYSWKTRASCGQPTSGLHFQFEFHITVLLYMGRVSVKQFVTNCNIKNMRFFLCTVYVHVLTDFSVWIKCSMLLLHVHLSKADMIFFFFFFFFARFIFNRRTRLS